MNTQVHIGRTVAICDRHGPDGPAMTAFLQSRDLGDVRWYAPRDIDDVEEAASAGGVHIAIFPNPASLLEPIWSGRMAVDRWLNAGTRIELAQPPEPSAGAWVAAVSDGWRAWQFHRRRQKMVAGAVLSLAAVAAGFTLLLLGV